MNQVLERGAALPATPVEPYSCIMRHKHEQPEGEALTEAARSAFERVGEQWTDMRAQLFNVIVGLDRPASAYDIADRFSEQRGRRVAANSVYRILDLFVAANIVTRVEVANRYLPNVHPGCVHDCILLFCEQCGRITHLDDDNIATSIRGAATNAGFRPGSAEGSVAHPIDGERNDQCDRAGAALADLRKTGKTTIRAADWPNGAPALLRHADRHLAGTRPVRGSVGAQRR